jgi:chromosome segregation ATPase
MIKKTLIEGAKETKALEARYIETLNEKIELDHQCKQLHQQLEHQSSNLTAFQEQLHELEKRKKSLELSLQAKEAEWIESCQQRQELQIQIENLNVAAKEKELIQDKYEQLKDEWKQINEHLEEATEARQQMDVHLNQLEAIAANQETQLQEFAEQLQMLHQGKDTLESERDQLKILLEESEARLKVAQQHLAKKVKEAALLSEKLEEQQASLTDFTQVIENQKTQIAQLQASVDLYQRQEKRLQEQLHEALKGTESQIVKWEEKYFRMYDKWQESEKRVLELKKFEEKHLQMQNLLANLGNFMGGAFNSSSHALFHAEQEIEERPASPFSFENSLSEEPLPDSSTFESQEEKYNLFGMPQPPQKD